MHPCWMALRGWRYLMAFSFFHFCKRFLANKAPLMWVHYRYAKWIPNYCLSGGWQCCYIVVACFRLQDLKMLKKPLGAFGDWSYSNILMRFVVIVVGKRCFIQTRTSCSEIAPLITFPWESVQLFWGQFISREESKWEPRSSQSETRCFNGNNDNNKKQFGEAFVKFGSFSTPEWKHYSRPQNLCGSAL